MSLLDELRTEVTFSDQEDSFVASVFALQQGNISRDLLKALRFLIKYFQANEVESLRQAVKDFMLKLLPSEYAPIAEAFDHPEEAMTLAERVIRNDKRERETVRKAALKEGRVEGRVEGQRRTLAKQFQLKFGTLNQATLARLEAADSDLLDQLTLRVLTAQSIDEIWN